MTNVINILDIKPIVYSVVMRHTGEAFSVMVNDVSEEKRSRLAVADDLERAARMIREDYL